MAPLFIRRRWEGLNSSCNLRGPCSRRSSLAGSESPTKGTPSSWDCARLLYELSTRHLHAVWCEVDLHVIFSASFFFLHSFHTCYVREAITLNGGFWEHCEEWSISRACEVILRCYFLSFRFPSFLPSWQNERAIENYKSHQDSIGCL